MLKLTRFRKWHMPNAVAIAAALLLLVSTLVSMKQPAEPMAAPLLAATQAGTIPQQAAESEQLAPAKQARKFRVNLFLFRH